MEAVLDQVEEDLGYVNTVDAGNVAKMTSWFERRGDDSQKARALYCLGRTQYNEKSYSAAIVNYTRALEYAERAGDPLHEGLICRDMAGLMLSILSTISFIPFLRASHPTWSRWVLT